MKLKDSLLECLRLTRALHDHIRAGDVSDSSGQLAARGQALDALGQLLTSASDADKMACASLITELRQADAELQEAGRSALQAASRDWNQSLGQQPRPQHSYDRAPDLACLDRKA